MEKQSSAVDKLHAVRFAIPPCIPKPSQTSHGNLLYPTPTGPLMAQALDASYE